jgi:hypothetical protein
MGIFSIFTTGKSKKNPYLASVHKKIAEYKAQQALVKPERTGAFLDRLKKERQAHENIADVKRKIKEDLAKAKAKALEELGQFRVEPDTSGIDPEDLSQPWTPVSSSNVAAIRWVGGDYGLQVRFLKKGWEYAYRVPHSTYEDMLAAPSKGQFVWYALRIPGVPYTRLTAGIAPSRLAYNFGRTVGGKYNRELLRNPAFALGKAAKSKQMKK